MISSDNYFPSFFRVPKGFRAPGLRAKKCRAPRQKNWRSRAQWLFSRAPLSQNHYFCPESKYKKALGSGLHDKNLGAPRLQGAPFEILLVTIKLAASIDFN